MQLRSLLVPLLALIPCACRSNGTQDQSGADEAQWTAENSSPAPGENAGAASAAPSEARAPSAPNANGTPVEAAAQQPGTQTPPSLESDVERAKLRAQQGSFLASEYIKKGDALLDRADLPGALEAYSSALNLDPTSQLAREKLHKVEGLMGTSYADAAGLLKDATEQEMVRRAQARLAAEDASMKGDNALRAGDLNTAIEQYRQAEMILRYHPLIATDSLDEKIVAGKLERAIQMSDEAARVAEHKAQEAAQIAKEKREREEREYRENKLRALYSEANTAFLNENFARAEELTELILAEDPGNPAATQLHAVARDSRHAKAEEQNREVYREQWIRTFEELDTMNVPQTDTLVFDDLKRWKEVSQRSPLEFTKLDPLTAEDKKAVLDRLDSVRVTPKFGTPEGAGSPLTEIAAFFQSLTGVNFMISPKVMTDLDEEQRSIKLDLPERSVRKVLDIIAETHENLKWKVEDGVVKFVTKDEMKGGQVLRTYEVRDLIHPIHDFPGQEMNVAPSGGYNPPEEDKAERESNVVSTEQLETLIRNNVAAGSWEADPQNAIKITPHGTMVVHQTPEVQDQIRKLLDDLREATGIMVDIQARFLQVEDNFLEDIGVDFRGLGQPGLGTNNNFNDFGDPSTQLDLGKEIGTSTDLGAFYDNPQSNYDVRGRVEELYDVSLGDQNVLTGSGGLSAQWTYLTHLQLEMVLRAVSKSERVELVTAPRITLYNTARGNLAVVNEVAYVQDFNVEIAQGASIADPIVSVVRDGIVLDVRPVVSADRRFITLELRPTIAQLHRPIREVSTTLGSQNSVTIQLPEVNVQRVRTSIPMPDGGTVMLGGTKVSDKQDLRSGVPILNKIPIVSFFFDRKGTYISNRKLLILLKANIVIPAEHEPTPAQVNPPAKKSGT
jgi:type II secretory pathway component GspD/PulD (secretin)/tetratricopeptide (TPR) repeat protein